jgi:hypothetical protein
MDSLSFKFRSWKETSVENKYHHGYYALEGELVEQIKYSLNNRLIFLRYVGTSAPSFMTVRPLFQPMINICFICFGTITNTDTAIK